MSHRRRPTGPSYRRESEGQTYAFRNFASPEKTVCGAHPTAAALRWPHSATRAEAHDVRLLRVGCAVHTFPKEEGRPPSGGRHFGGWTQTPGHSSQSAHAICHRDRCARHTLPVSDPTRQIPGHLMVSRQPRSDDPFASLRTRFGRATRIAYPLRSCARDHTSTNRLANRHSCVSC
jgi:hypothetical protein